jgi:hypothetical protein
MGIFSSIRDASRIANEDAHGVRLERGLRDTQRCLAALREDVRAKSILSFVHRRRELLKVIANWSVDGCLQAGRKLQDEARAKFNFDQSESYALWMTGAWLESGIRNSEKAQSVYLSLDELAHEVEERQSNRLGSGLGAQNRGERAAPLVKLIKAFDQGWDAAVGTAAALSGLREVPPLGDKSLAILWGAIHELARSIEANEREKMVATLKFLHPYPDAANVYRRMEQLAVDPTWASWIELARRAVASHISQETDASAAYMTLAVQYLRTGGR